MKLFKIAAVATALTFSSFAGAADIEGGVLTSDVSTETQPLTLGNTPMDIAISQIDLSKYERFLEKANRKANKGKPGDDVTANAVTAAGISYFETYSVFSSNVGWEYFTSNQSTTNLDHSGNTIVLASIQLGAGYPYQAQFSGQSRTATTYPLCGSVSNLHHCYFAGELVTGYIYAFNYSWTGIYSGTFSSSAQSTGFPWNFWSDSIYIR